LAIFKKMNLNEKFSLQWNDFQQNISSTFQELRGDVELADVTLACEDGQVEAHKIVLASGSKFFSTVLSRNKHPHPLIYLKGLKSRDLAAVLDFLYHGQVDITEKDLNIFLAIAEDLEVKGLVGTPAFNDIKYFQGEKAKQSKKENKKDDNARQENVEEKNVVLAIAEDLEEKSFDDTPKVNDKYLKEGGTKQYNNETKKQNNEDKTHAPILPELGEVVREDTSIISYDTFTEHKTEPLANNENQDLDQQINSMLLKAEGVWACTECDKTSKIKFRMKRHIETHIQVSHACANCGRFYSSRNSLQTHNYTKCKSN